MKTKSIFQSVAVLAFSILTVSITMKGSDHNPAAGHDRLIVPKPLVAFSGDDGGCVPSPITKGHQQGAGGRGFEA
jgi:hypothetical protein